MSIFSDTMGMAQISMTLLSTLFLISTMICAALCFAFENSSSNEENHTFNDMFEAIYWAIVTQTTLGYGDIGIVSAGGRIMACVTVIIGIINLTFAINIIGICFEEAYQRYLSQQEASMTDAVNKMLLGEKEAAENPDGEMETPNDGDDTAGEGKGMSRRALRNKRNAEARAKKAAGENENNAGAFN